MKALAFPEGFLWGCAVSAHQVEGENTGNQWWRWEEQGRILDGSTSGRACDHYNRYEEDFDIASFLGLKVFRTSVEWSRIEPKEGVINNVEVEHYRKVLSALRDRGIEPMVTLHHFTNPLWFEDQGGWLNPRSPEIFESFARIVVENLGDLFSIYNTINEPMIAATMGYLFGIFPPGERSLDKCLTAARNMLLAHGRAYQAIHETCKSLGYPKPMVAPVKQMIPFEPLNPLSKEDVEEARRRNHFFNECMLESINTGAIQPPLGTGEEQDYLKDSWDFIGVNYYSRTLCTPQNEEFPLPFANVPEGAERSDQGLEVYPDGLRKVLLSLKQYGKPLIVTENGIATRDDEQRRRYLVRHLKAVHDAISQGADVKGYIYWSLIDNFEWVLGYQMKFGLVEVNFESMERRLRESAYLYKEIIEKNMLLPEHLEKYA
ncbi:MAG: glycoside hydrolase family 1 protein [Candidatus Freyarchaeota archaeon]|nr:glycoside hydrolase family 1 protein [Candidatus Freyrarchaeum guaymaensis]